MITKLDAAVALGFNATLRQNKLFFDVDNPPPEVEIQNKLAELQAAEPLRLLRLQRDRLISETDWRATVDYPKDDQAEWLTYRQSLRDITTQTPELDDQGNLTGITWPIPPTD